MKSLPISWPKSGTYILAVSGGVDSMALLDLFSEAAKDYDYRLIVAHFDHAMRSDSQLDADFVRTEAAKYGHEVHSGITEHPLGNEAEARLARYGFLNIIAKNNHANGIITAHHQDDLIETSLLNLARGSKRVGLAPFASSNLLRPLMNIPRKHILDYAHEYGITWREDPTNADISNPRNFIRHTLIPQSSSEWRKHYLAAIDAMSEVNQTIDEDNRLALVQATNDTQFTFKREVISVLTLDEVAEVLLAIVRELAPGVELSSRLVQELVIFAKTAKPGRVRPIRESLEMAVERDIIKIYAMPSKLSPSLPT
ncbi:MAG: tRNA lysidine(34) synthetase TilS [Candidatus Saccharibacteria bacterium]